MASKSGPGKDMNVTTILWWLGYVNTEDKQLCYKQLFQFIM